MKFLIRKLINGKNVRQLGFGFQSKLDVVAEKKVIPDRDQVPRDAVVRGSNTLGVKQHRFDGTENFFAALVELLQTLAQLLTKTIQPIANDFVSVALQRNLFTSWSVLFNLCLSHRWIIPPLKELAETIGAGGVISTDHPPRKPRPIDVTTR